jgi:hypothetical protein
MDGTILGQGSFTVPATVTQQVIAIPSGVDWMKVYNYTQAGIDGAANTGVEFYWQRGMAPGTGMVKYKTAAGVAGLSETTFTAGVSPLTANSGFTLYDPSGQTVGAVPLLSAPINFSAITNATRPVVTTTSTVGLAVGMVVKLSPMLANGTTGTALISNLSGQSFVIGTIVSATQFTLLTVNSAFPAAPGITTGTGSFRVVNYNSLFYPRARVITNISNAVNATVSTAIAHGLTPGQEVRFNIPAVSGMVQLNPTVSTGTYFPQGSSVSAIVVTVVDDYDFTINIDTTGYTAFTYPTIGQQPSSFPEVTPFGEDTATALLSTAAQTPTIGGLQIFNTNTGILADSTVNTGFLGMVLGIGGAGNGAALAGGTVTGPAGSIAGDVMYWTTGKSSFGGL